MSRSRTPGLLTIPILAASMLLSASPALARGTLDQKQEETSGVGFLPNFAQTFTPAITGDLDTVSFVPQDSDLTGTIVTLRPTSNGAPTSSILATAVFTSSVDEDWSDVSFPGPVHVDAGTLYALYIVPIQRVGLKTGHGYPGGMEYDFYNGQWYPYETSDLAFRTYVTPHYGFAWKAPTLGKGNGINRPQAGTTVPVTFTLDGRMKPSKVLAEGWPKVRPVDCTTKAQIAGTTEQTKPLGVKGLKLVVTRAGAHYSYSWNTRAQWGIGADRACRQLRIKLADGTIHSAIFRFQRPSP